MDAAMKVAANNPESAMQAANAVTEQQQKPGGLKAVGGAAAVGLAAGLCVPRGANIFR